jgi:DNA-binding FadR family transcriptional regulator
VARFAGIAKSSLYESVAAAIENAIMSGEVKLGEKLPSEQSLAQQFGVSRNILREALRAVKARGLLDVRNGDGTYISRPDSADLGDMLNRVVTLSDSTINHYYEIRFTLEVKACELAAQRATREDLRELESLVSRMGKNGAIKEKVTQLDYEFHLGVARATKNPLFPSFLQPLKKLMTGMFYYAFPSTEGRHDALRCHLEIVDAIRRKDPALAGAAMRRHLESSENNISHLVHSKGAHALAHPRRAATKRTAGKESMRR